ncbi:hypothetical protein HID58_091385, partial [Brassica napus]
SNQVTRLACVEQRERESIQISFLVFSFSLSDITRFELVKVKQRDLSATNDESPPRPHPFDEEDEEIVNPFSKGGGRFPAASRPVGFAKASMLLLIFPWIPSMTLHRNKESLLTGS